MNPRIRTEIDVNECEHFLKANLDRSEIVPSWMDLSENGPIVKWKQDLKSGSHVRHMHNHNQSTSHNQG